jgi:hypothetical protein
MGIVENLVTLLFGGSQNAVTETVEVFRENAEKSTVRGSEAQAAALAQFRAEFGLADRSGFDRLIDGLNRLPRPFLALGTIGLFVAAMIDPIWFVSRMEGMALVPEPLWWLMGAIVSFYFGARYQVKGQEFITKIAKVAAVSVATEPAEKTASVKNDDYRDNAALLDWQA